MRNFATALIDGVHVVMCLMIEVQTKTGFIRYNTSDWDIPWNGFTWFAGDRLVSVRRAEEDLTGSINGAVVTIGALDPATTSLAMSETLEGKSATIYVALFNPPSQINPQMVLQEVVKEYSGRVSNLILTKQFNGQSSNG